MALRRLAKLKRLWLPPGNYQSTPLLRHSSSLPLAQTLEAGSLSWSSPGNRGESQEVQAMLVVPNCSPATSLGLFMCYQPRAALS